MDIIRNILIFGDSSLLGALAHTLRASPLLRVECRASDSSLANLRPDIILVDAEEVTPEQFFTLIAIGPTIISVDPLTYQLTVLSFPRHLHPVAEVARVVEMLSFTLHSPAQAAGANQTRRMS